ncbi:MAG: AAA family ATPase [Verrucomicrobiota bacterium]
MSEGDLNQNKRVQLEIRVKNYRCFGGHSPSGFKLKRGITGFIGENNSGKSTMLRLFYDLRSLFQEASRRLRTFHPNDDLRFSLPSLPDNIDRDRFFHLHNPDPLVIEITSGGCELHLICGRDGQIRWNCGMKRRKNSHMVRDLEKLTRMFYIGPFRPFQTQGASGKSYDVLFGKDFFGRCIEDFRKGRFEKGSIYDRVNEDVATIFHLDGFSFEPGPNGRYGFRINREWMPASELASGLGQCFLIFVQAIWNKPSFILIDEPEAHLHPTVQSEFLTMLTGYAQYGLLASTHHLGLAQSVSDHLYKVSRKHGQRESVIEVYEPDKRLSQTLGEMQVSVQKNNGGQRLLLVEGPTEIKAIRQLLRKIRRNHSVVLMPLGGSSMINGNREDELREVKKICEEVFALVDSEKTSERARVSHHHRSFRESCQRVGIYCHILKRRALENYFSDRAVRKVLGPKQRAPRPYEDIKEVDSRWPKSENWKIIREMRRDEIDRTDLWDFLERIIKKSETSPRRRSRARN